jgi:hypothetical protein
MVEVRSELTFSLRLAVTDIATGGAQNIKMKSKDKDGVEKPEKKGGFRSLKNFV